jgi:hypothetical protein
MRPFTTVLLALALPPLLACQTHDLGTGVNTVDREYARPAAEVCKAALACAAAGDFKVVDGRYDQFGGDLVMSRMDGKEIRVQVRSLDEKSSRAGIRVEPGDRDLATLLHERLAGELGLGVAAAGWWFGGESIEATYEIELSRCAASARRTLAAVAETAKDEESHSTWFQIDGRLKDSTPVRIRADANGDRKTRVRFIVGVSRSDEYKVVALRMKSEFEANLAPPVSGR